MKKGFTLAEVLITLGIIGVVAAITIPTLTTRAYKNQTATKVHKFYSVMNQTIRASIAENDDPSGWIIAKNYTYNETVNFLKTYFLPYMKFSTYKKCSDYGMKGFGSTGVCTTMNDGSIFATLINDGSIGIIYYADGNLKRKTTRNTFAFELGSNNSKYTQDRYFMQPHIFAWDGKRESHKTDNARGCKNNSTYLVYCTKLLELSNWKFPSDYPW